MLFWGFTPDRVSEDPKICRGRCGLLWVGSCMKFQTWLGELFLHIQNEAQEKIDCQVNLLVGMVLLHTPLSPALWDFIHNAIAHPLLVTRMEWSKQFHDWTAEMMDVE